MSDDDRWTSWLRGRAHQQRRRRVEAFTHPVRSAALIGVQVAIVMALYFLLIGQTVERAALFGLASGAVLGPIIVLLLRRSERRSGRD